MEIGKTVKGNPGKNMKVRNLMSSEDEDDEICLNDVIKAFVGASKYIVPLEYKSNPHALRSAKAAFKKAKIVCLNFEKRLKEEVTQEIIKSWSKENPNEKMSEIKKHLE